MGYELLIDQNIIFYKEAYSRWTRYYTLPTLNDNLASLVIRSTDVLLLDLKAQNFPIYENINLMRLLILIDQIDNDEKIYANSIINKLPLTHHFWNNNKELVLELVKSKYIKCLYNFEVRPNIYGNLSPTN